MSEQEAPAQQEVPAVPAVPAAAPVPTPPQTARRGGNKNINSNNSNNKKPVHHSSKRPTGGTREDVLARLYSPSPRRNKEEEHAEKQQQEGDEQQHHHQSHSRGNSPTLSSVPIVNTHEYLAALRERQHTQLESLAAYLESDRCEAVGALVGRDMHGRPWSYGPSYSRRVEALEPQSCHYAPVTARSRQRVRAAASGGLFPGGMPTLMTGSSPSRPGTARSAADAATAAGGHSSARSSRPGTARSTVSSSTVASARTVGGYSSQCSEATFYDVIKTVPVNVPASASTARNGFSFDAPPTPIYGVPQTAAPLTRQQQQQQQQQQQHSPTSGRSLTCEYNYSTRFRPAGTRTDAPPLSKADAAIAQHAERKRKLEAQRQRLKNAAPMQFKWLA